MMPDTGHQEGNWRRANFALQDARCKASFLACVHQSLQNVLVKNRIELIGTLTYYRW